ncbi:MAG: DMT family transporter [Gammaproteobacteria bacterium]|nr:DMT family transporter [Gammaproteobacteria bacterium]
MNRPSSGPLSSLDGLTLGPEGRGLLLAVAVACSFATNSTLARIAYEGGSNALSMLTVRTGTALLVLVVLLQRVSTGARLSRGRSIAAFALGLLLASYSYGLLGAIQYMPLAMVLVTFYTFPLLTALASAALGREPLRSRTLLALGLALYGLSLVLDLSDSRINALGISHALVAAVCFTTLLLCSDRVRGDGDSRLVTLRMLITGFAVYLLACALSGAFALPRTTLGWVGFIGCPLFYSFSFISLFSAVSLAGPVRTALVMNVEPVASAIFGYLLLAQVLSGWQVLGMATVVGAVIYGRLPQRRSGAGSDWLTVLLLGAGVLLLIAAVRIGSG